MMIDPLTTIRAIHFASVVMAVGVIFFRFFVVEPALGRTQTHPPFAAALRRRLAALLWGSLVVAVGSGAGWLLLLAAEIGERPLAATFSDDVAWTLWTSTRFGQLWTARLVLAASIAGWLVAFGSDEKPWSSGWRGLVAAALAAALIGSLALAGHGGSTPGTAGDFHLASDALHLVAAGAWVGGLVPLALLLAAARRGADPRSQAVAPLATRRFSTLGVISVATLLASGTVNTLFLAGSWPTLVGTTYGQLLLLKIALFAAMVFIAAINRRRLTPRLADLSRSGPHAMRRLTRNSLMEAGLGLVILFIVGALGNMPPGLHAQPWWPLPFRLAKDAFEAPGLRIYALAALVSIIAGCALVLAGIAVRRRRWPMIAAGLLAVACFAWNAGRLTVQAFPTSFQSPPIDYSVRSIAQGKALFAEHCAACHGKDGLGKQPAGTPLDKAPLDLTAAHMDDRLDGDLFWWISSGSGPAMPGFAAILDDGARWSLVDFIRAIADAQRLRGMNGAAVPAPDLAAECPDGTGFSMGELRGDVVHLIVAGPLSTQRAALAAETADDLVTVVVPLDAAAMESVNVCVTRDPAAGEALALYRGSDVAALDGTEFLIDPHGSLRSMWYPGLEPDWNDYDVFRHRVESIRNGPAVEPPEHGHAHMH